jgi:hypothetical protein
MEDKKIQHGDNQAGMGGPFLGVQAVSWLLSKPQVSMYHGERESRAIYS